MADAREWPRLGELLPALIVGTVAALIGCHLGRRDHGSSRRRDAADVRAPEETSIDLDLRNARLTYRPLGASGEPYPDWVRALKGKSGVYVIREVRRDGSSEVVYVGESHTGRLYHTLTRHFQTWRRSKKFWSGQYGGQGHDPGLTYPRERVMVAARILASPERAMTEERRLISSLHPRDNLIGQPDQATEDVIPF